MNALGNQKAKICERYTVIKRKESKHTTRKKHQFTKKDSNRGRKEQRNYKIIRKQLTKW